MPDHVDFLKSVFNHPDDPRPRLVYADWLEEQGNRSGALLRDPGLWEFFQYGNYFWLAWKLDHPKDSEGVVVSECAVPADKVLACRCGAKSETLDGKAGLWRCRGCRCDRPAPPFPWSNPSAMAAAADESFLPAVEGGFYRALSLWQPWATLVVAGEKRVETRSWYTSFRGRILVHAATTWGRKLRNLCESDPFRAALVAANARLNGAGVALSGGFIVDLPRGAFLGTVDVVDCVEILDQPRGVPLGNRVVRIPPPDPERCFGDYTPGRYAWVLDNPRALRRPIPYRGHQRLFRVPTNAVLDALAAPHGPNRIVTDSGSV